MSKVSKDHLIIGYLDDIWGIWEHIEQEFQEFLNVLNAHDPSIQLTSVLNVNNFLTLLFSKVQILKCLINLT